jgi:hypothetical protein
VFVGHYGVSFAAKRAAPSLSLAWLPPPSGPTEFAVQALFAYLVLALWAGWVDKPGSKQLFDQRAGVLR